MSDLQSLSSAEELLLRSIQTGTEADYRTRVKAEDDVQTGSVWGAERTLRGEKLCEFLVGNWPECTPSRKGIIIRGAKIAGPVNLNASVVKVPILFSGCYFEDKFSFSDATLLNLAIVHSHLKSISGSRATVLGNLRIGGSKFVAKGELDLIAIEIGGQLNLSGGRFENPNGDAISLDGANIKNDVFLTDGFVAKGTVRLLGAKIGGELSCVGARFERPTETAIFADGLTVKEGVYFTKGFCSIGAVSLSGAVLGGDLCCFEGSFRVRKGIALDLNQSTTTGSVELNDKFIVRGGISAIGAAIGGDFDCTGGRFVHTKQPAICADRITIRGNVRLRDKFSARGAVRFNGSRIEGQFDCEGGTFRSSKGALSLERAKIANGLVLRGAEFRGTINLSYGIAGIVVDSENSWPKPNALLLDGFVYEGFGGRAPTNADARIRWLRLQPMKNGRFWPQPYQQMVKVLRQMGHEQDAKRVAIAKQNDLRKFGQLSRRQKLFNWLSWVLIAHGYRPFQALGWMALFVILGAILFDAAFEGGEMRPSKERIYMSSCYFEQDEHCTKVGWTVALPQLETEKRYLPRDYPKFNPFLYSLDVFLPIVDLHQEAHWYPNSRYQSSFYWWFMWFQILVGWALTTIFVVGITGIVRKD